MSKTILITGSTDGIGLATAKSLVSAGHRVLLHGRSQRKLDAAKAVLSDISHQAFVDTFLADLSSLTSARQLALAVKQAYPDLDVLINNAGVYVVPQISTAEGLDTRFAVNTVAPYLLTRLLQDTLGQHGRVINTASAAQAPFDIEEIGRVSSGSDSAVYAKSKLALIAWTQMLAAVVNDSGPVMLAVNPGSFLGSKMVKEAYGMRGENLQKGANILVRASLDLEFAGASGQYFDNDIDRFSAPHPAAATKEVQMRLLAELDRLTA